MKKLRAWILLPVLALACEDRLASTDEIPVDPLCLRSLGTMGYWLDGSRRHVFEAGVGTPHACVCITEEQWWDEVEITRLGEQLQGELLVECERIAALQGFDWNECQIDHDSGQWKYLDMAYDEIWAPAECPGEGWVGPSSPNDEPPFMCDLGEPGCSCTVEAVCTGGSVCIDGMCQTPP